ncbi:hypothetical protein ILUMI_16675, partial [Ignelater luminosus]
QPRSPGLYITDGWLTRWKNRHGIVYKKLHGEKQDADEHGARDWIQRTWPEVLAKYRRGDIYNMDETGLYYRATPNYCMVFKNESDEGKGTANEIAKQISVLDAIRMADSAWGRVTPQCIANCFKISGMAPQFNEPAPPVSEVTVDLDIREGVEIDCDVPVHREMDLDEIANSVVIAEKDSTCESDEDDVPVERVPVTRNDVIGAIGVLRRAVEENGLEEQFPVLRKLEVSLENVFPTLYQHNDIRSTETPARKRKMKTSGTQYELYVEMLESNAYFRENKITPDHPNDVSEGWEMLIKHLNASRGPQKTLPKWKSVFADWKSQVRKRARLIQNVAKETGNKDEPDKDLTELEKKLSYLTGDVVVEGIAGVPEIDI